MKNYAERDLDMDRLSPLDWCYAPGAAGPKFCPPPELRVVREELPQAASKHLKDQRCQLPYSSAYDVWCLGWTFIQIILGERWEDWKTCRDEDALATLVQSHFFDKKRQVEVPWELDSYTSAWRLKILACGREEFQEKFLHTFYKHATNRLLGKGPGQLTPLQEEFIMPESNLRQMLGRMLTFEPRARAEYLTSGALLADAERLTPV